MIFKKIRIRPFKSYDEWVIDRLKNERNFSSLTFPIMGWTISILYFGIILPLLYVTDYKIRYIREKEV